MCSTENNVTIWKKLTNEITNNPSYSNYTMSLSSQTNYLQYNQGDNKPGLVLMKAS